MTKTKISASATICFCANAASYLDEKELINLISLSYDADKLNEARKELSNTIFPAGSTPAPTNLSTPAKRASAQQAAKDIAEALTKSPPNVILQMDALQIGALPGMSRESIKGASNVAAAVTKTMTDTIIASANNQNPTQTTPAARKPANVNITTNNNTTKQQISTKPKRTAQAPTVNTWAKVAAKKTRKKKGDIRSGKWENYDLDTAVKHYRIYINAQGKVVTNDDIIKWSDSWNLVKRDNNSPVIKITQVTNAPSFCVEFDSRTRDYEKAIPMGIRFGTYKDKSSPIPYSRRKRKIRLYLNRVSTAASDDDIKKVLLQGFTDVDDQNNIRLTPLPPFQPNKPVEYNRFYCTITSSKPNTPVQQRAETVLPFDVSFWKGRPPANHKKLDIVAPKDYADLKKLSGDSYNFKRITYVDREWLTTSNKFSTLNESGPTGDGSVSVASGSKPTAPVPGVTEPK